MKIHPVMKASECAQISLLSKYFLYASVYSEKNPLCRRHLGVSPIYLTGK